MTSAIVLVDDEKVILDSLKAQLSGFFHNRYLYETAESVAEAWEIIEELVALDTEIIVIVSDWLMPGTKGDEFLVELAAKHPSIRTVLLTGHADARAVRRVIDEARVDRVIAKPWNADELRAIVESATRESLVS
ncbi:MAG: response regulator [Deltaproteobacteria bacterium]|nr:response regulator [Deltaproteobacteria bacterium]